MSKRKIKLVVHPADQSPSQIFQISWKFILLYFFILIFAGGGILLAFWKPHFLYSVWEDTHKNQLYRQNTLLKDSLKNLSFRNQEAAKNLDFLQRTYQKVASLGGVPEVDSSIKESMLISTSSDTLAKEYSKILAQVDSTYQKLKNQSKLMAHLPTIYPLKKNHKICTGFETIMDPFIGKSTPHLGVDFSAQIGDTIVATGNAMVSRIHSHKSKGLTLLLNHGFKTKSFYAHLSKLLVKQGQRVKRGQAIALAGSTGLSSGPHLHYEILYNGKNKDPTHYLIETNYAQ